MFHKIFSYFQRANTNDPASRTLAEDETRRRDMRRSGDPCVIVLHDKLYPVENWSFGGVQIKADDRTFTVDEEHPMTLKFNLSDTIMSIPSQARVVRKGSQKIAFQFSPVSHNVRQYLQVALNDILAGQFIESQQ